jgi:hypothetical protein
MTPQHGGFRIFGDMKHHFLNPQTPLAKTHKPDGMLRFDWSKDLRKLKKTSFSEVSPKTEV